MSESRLKTGLWLVIVAGLAAGVGALLSPPWAPAGTIQLVDTKAPAGHTCLVTAAGERVDANNPVHVTGTVTATTSGLATAAHQVTQNTAQSTLKAATDMMAASGGGIYIRQDSTATLAKESGGNLAAIKGCAGEVALDANSWVDVSTITGRLALLTLRTTTAGGSTSVGTLYGAASDPNLHAWVVADAAGDPIQGRTMTAHTIVDPNTTYYRTSLLFVRGAATKLQYKRTSGTAQGGLTYRVVGQ